MMDTLNTLENGYKVNEVVLVTLLTQIIKFTWERFFKKESMVLEENSIKQETLIMGSGSIIKNTALEFLNFLMEMFTKDFGKITRKMGKEPITFKMAIGIKVIGRMIVCKETEIIILRMVISFQDNGIKINKMVKGYKHFIKEVDTKAILKTE